MRKINSIGYGGRIAAAAGIFLVAVPLTLLILNAILPFPGFKTWVYVSLAVGALVALSLIILLVIELKQDKKINAYYLGHRNMKMYLGNGAYECQSCGSRDVTAQDTACRVCGIRLINNIENRP